MLSMTFLGVSGLPGCGAVGYGGARWSIRVRHGEQRRRTGSILQADLQHEVEGGAAAATGQERAASRSLWDENLEVHDREGEERVEIAVVAEVAGSRATKNPDSVSQWIAEIDMSTFRQQPDKCTTFWLPLRPVASHVGEPFGAIEMAVTYNSEDCVAQGYVYALFCGLVPVSWMDSFLSISPWGDMHQQSKIADRVKSRGTPSRKKRKPTSPSSPSSSPPAVAEGDPDPSSTCLESSPDSCTQSETPGTVTI